MTDKNQPGLQDQKKWITQTKAGQLLPSLKGIGHPARPYQHLGQFISILSGQALP